MIYKENYTLSHKEVQQITRRFMVDRGYKVVTKKYRKCEVGDKHLTPEHRLRGRSMYDDVFAAPNGEDVICEYKPTPISRDELLRGFGQILLYTTEIRLRTYLVINILDYRRFEDVIDNTPWMGLFVYTDKRITMWRKPISLLQLPEPNNVQVECSEEI